MNAFSKNLALLLLLLLLSACAVSPSEQPRALPESGAGSPEAAVTSFFADLSAAFADPALFDEEGRQRWAERLANAFSPGERIRQRGVFLHALDSYMINLNQIAAESPDSQTQVVFDLQPQPIQVTVVRQHDNRADVKLVDATLTVRIVRNQNGHQDLLYQQDEPLVKLIGREDGTIPVIQLDGRWYLSTI